MRFGYKPYADIFERVTLTASQAEVADSFNKLADAVRVTLGPQSRRVLIARKWGVPVACDDGITIVSSIDDMTHALRRTASLG